MNTKTKLSTLALSTIALSFVSQAAFADSSFENKKIALRSAQGLQIFVDATVEQTAPSQTGSFTKEIKSFEITTSQFGAFRAVVTLQCSAMHYPNSWSYQSSFTLDGFQSSGGAPFKASDYSRRRIESLFSGDRDECRVELSLVKDGIWQQDPINGTNNFLLDL